LGEDVVIKVGAHINNINPEKTSLKTHIDVLFAEKNKC